MTFDLITWQGQKCKCFLSVFYDRARTVLEYALEVVLKNKLNFTSAVIRSIDLLVSFCR